MEEIQHIKKLEKRGLIVFKLRDYFSKKGKKVKIFLK